MEITEERLAKLAAECRAAETAASDARERRDRAIDEADQAGYKLRRIAAWTGMSPGHVQRIVGRKIAERQERARRALTGDQGVTG